MNGVPRKIPRTMPRTISLLTRNGLKPIATIDEFNRVVMVSSSLGPVQRLNKLIVNEIFVNNPKKHLPKEPLVVEDIEAHILDIVGFRRCSALIVLQHSNVSNRLLAYTDSGTNHPGESIGGIDCEGAKTGIQDELTTYTDALNGWISETELKNTCPSFNPLCKFQAVRRGNTITQRRLNSIRAQLDAAEKKLKVEVAESTCSRWQRCVPKPVNTDTKEDLDAQLQTARNNYKIALAKFETQAKLNPICKRLGGGGCANMNLSKDLPNI